MNNKNNLENIFWRENVVSCALAYANHIWKPTIKNLFHGYDTDGIVVNTPDSNYTSTKYNCGWWIIDQLNKGMPYNWGGFSTTEEFDTGITAGKFAGNVPECKDNGVSQYCIGVDCSGLVTICWDLAERVTTKTITNIASPLDSMDLLLPGDVILLPGSHVMIFINFVEDKKKCAQIVDASRSTGRVLLRTENISDLIKKGYRGYRKNIE
ncbi:MAG: hypothetical protein APF77_21845 [Clostridia bacterium BRH_c25]|nr:MAG: hypothetical protein APF77_21845 [Clostridia bacterium BRH_c25]